MKNYWLEKIAERKLEALLADAICVYVLPPGSNRTFDVDQNFCVTTEDIRLEETNTQ